MDSVIAKTATGLLAFGIGLVWAMRGIERWLSDAGAHDQVTSHGHMQTANGYQRQRGDHAQAVR